ncbi:MAG: PQQ-binding-like beta-propeller repeat protein [Alphaproteobacteria bacterium]|nr:PQQ-binding-like beta-propeller repeat protein [Alphaproteobacteria bacterium]
MNQIRKFCLFLWLVLFALAGNGDLSFASDLSKPAYRFPNLGDYGLNFDFDSENRYLAVSNLGSASIFDIEKNKLVFTKKFDALVKDVAFSPDGLELAVGLGDAGIQILDYDDPANPVEMNTSGKWNTVNYTADGAHLATHDWQHLNFSNRDDAAHWQVEVDRFWPLNLYSSDNEIVGNLEGSKTVFQRVSRAHSSDGDIPEAEIDGTAILAFRRPQAGDFLLIYKDLGTQEILGQFTAPLALNIRLKDFREGPDGPRAVLWITQPNGPQIVIFDPKSNQVTFRLNVGSDAYSQYSDIALSPDGHWLALNSKLGSVDVYSTAQSHDGVKEPADASPDPPALSLSLGHNASIISIDASSTGDLLATAGRDQRTLVWDLNSGRFLRRIAEGEHVHHVSFSPDGDSLATLSVGVELSIWDVGTGELRERFPVNQTLAGGYIGGEGKLFLCGTVDCAYGTTLEFAGNKPTVFPLPIVLQYGNFRNLALSEDGTKAALLVDGEGLYLFDFRNMSMRKMSIPPKDLGSDTSQFTAVNITHDGRIVAGSDLGTLSKFNFDDGTKIWSKQISSDPIGNIINAGNGHIAASVQGSKSEHGYYLIDAQTGETVRSPDRSAGSQEGMTPGLGAYVKKHDRLVTVSQSSWRNEYELDVWWLREGRHTNLQNHRSLSPNRIFFSHDGNNLYVENSSGFGVWDIRRGRLAAYRDDVAGRTTYLTNTGLLYAGDNDDGLVHETVRGGARTVPLGDENRHSDKRSDDSIFLLEREIIARFHDFNQNTYLVRFDRESIEDGFWRAPNVTRLTGKIDSTDVLAISPDGDLVLPHGNYSTEKLTAYDARTGLAKWDMSFERTPQFASFSHDGQWVFVSGDNRDIWAEVLDVSTGDKFAKYAAESYAAEEYLIATAPNGLGQLLVHTKDDQIQLLSNDGQEVVEEVSGNGISMNYAISDISGQMTLFVGFQDEVLLWDRRSGSRVIKLASTPEGRQSITFAPSGNLLAIGESSGIVSIWNVETGERLARLSAFPDGSWAVVGEDGRYDASDPGDMPQISWIMPDAPNDALPIEMFYREYFEPGLLPRLIAGEAFAPLPSPKDLNRLQPDVIIDAIVTDPDDKTVVTVTVTAKNTVSDNQGSGLSELKLFRDGQLVGVARGNQTLLIEDNGSDSSRTFQFDGVHLPNRPEGAEAGDVVFSAYGFNAEGIKSRTERVRYALPKSEQSGGRRAYIFAIGIDHHQNPSWNLRYAGADAHLSARLLAQGLTQSEQFEKVTTVKLITTGNNGHKEASRAQIEAVLLLLAGKPVDSALLAGIEGADELQKAMPDDVIYISFSGHGFAAEDGRFHLFPQDIGTASHGRVVDAKTLTRTLNSDRLADLIRDLQAQDITLVIDACNSAASVEGKAFKPGPMGSRGLGQLAYDKAMRILTASQAEEFAIEAEVLRHGVLSYSMYWEGVVGESADISPSDGKVSLSELFDYAVDRVPTLYEEITNGDFRPAVRGSMDMSFATSGTMPAASRQTRISQTPALFDFRRTQKREPVFLHLR